MTWRPVAQTRTGFPSGNCAEAAIASLLGCDLDVELEAVVTLTVPE